MTFNSLFFLFVPIKCVFFTQIETGKMYTSLTHYLLLEQILNALNIENSGRAQRNSDSFSQLLSYGERG